MRPYRGAYVRPIPAQGELRDLAWGATLRRVAPRRRVPGGLTIQLRPDDLLRKLRMQRPRRLLLLVVDVSGSMGGALMDLARRTALGLLDQAYLDRDPVAMIAFCQRSAELLLPPTRHAAQVPRALVDLTCGGTTPLAAGLQLAERTLLAHARREAAPSAALLLISDGRANVGAHPGQAALDAELKAVARRLSRTPNLQRIFVDTTAAGQDDHAARWLATQLHADRHLLWQLQQRSPDPARTLAQELIRALR
ncbi:MAG: VWA domain-containing protein [bacterium]